ncbi:MAG: DUF4279 domain-containing protein [Actinophytocola sp.]|uniref:DUF4279 domain-containing protein n=1 Tax=Actinophytocola sp. TaxID=1872138 RepID=UPI003C70C266
MRIRQYVYFVLTSRTTTAQQMTDKLGLAPDEVGVAGARRINPPMPVAHSWQLACRAPGLRVDEQIAAVIARLLPYRERVVELARDLSRADPGHGGAKLGVVRYLDDPDGEIEQLSSPQERFHKLAGQHQLLGWVLEPTVMAFLVDVNAAIDVDEYS